MQLLVIASISPAKTEVRAAPPGPAPGASPKVFEEQRASFGRRSGAAVAGAVRPLVTATGQGVERRSGREVKGGGRKRGSAAGLRGRRPGEVERDGRGGGRSRTEPGKRRAEERRGVLRPKSQTQDVSPHTAASSRHFNLKRNRQHDIYRASVLRRGVWTGNICAPGASTPAPAPAGAPPRHAPPRHTPPRRNELQRRAVRRRVRRGAMEYNYSCHRSNLTFQIRRELISQQI